MSVPGIAAVRKIIKTFFRLLRPGNIGRNHLLVAALLMVLAGAVAARTLDGSGHKPTLVQNTQNTNTDNTDADTESGSDAPEAEAETPADSTQTKPGQPAKNSSKMEIIADIPRTTFRVGEDSGEITIKTSTGTAVDWGFYVDPNQAVSVVVKHIYTPGKSPTAKIKLVTGNPVVAEPGTYTLIIKAYKPGNISTVLATKSITVTLERIIPFTFNIADEYMTYDEDTGELCTPYHITTLPHLNLMNINVTAQIIAGDTTGIYVSVHPPSNYYAGNRICIGLMEPTSLGPRTIRATATAYEYTTTDDLEIEVIE